jgi:ComEC/Rec2-related protein
MLKIKPLPLICFYLALVLSLYLGGFLRNFPIFAFIAVCAGGAGISLFLLAHPAFRKSGMIVIALSLGFLFGIALDTRMTYDRRAYFTGVELAKVSSYKGTCTTDSVPYAEKKGSMLTLDLASVYSRELGASAKARGRVLVFADSVDKFYAGEMVEITGKLSIAKNQSSANLSGGASISDIKRTGFDSIITDGRHRTIGLLNGLIEKMGYPASSLFRALFLGAREDLSEEISESFKTTGTLHILALSGMHVGLIYSLINLLCAPFLSKRQRLAASIAVISIYVYIAGASPSLLRAGLMILALGAGKMLDRETNPLNLLALSAVIILLVDPASAFSLSFQLSYLAMLGIFIIGDPIARFLRPYMPGFIGVPIAYSIGAQVFTIPLIVSCFGIVYFQGFIVTLILGPLITIFLAGGILSLFVFAFPVYAVHDLLGFIFGRLYEIIFLITHFFSTLGGVNLGWSPVYPIIFALILFPFVLDPKMAFASVSRLWKANRLKPA